MYSLHRGLTLCWRVVTNVLCFRSDGCRMTAGFRAGMSSNQERITNPIDICITLHWSVLKLYVQGHHKLYVLISTMTPSVY